MTRAKKGIGFAMVKRLAHLGLTVILAARDIEKGHKAIEELRNQGLDDVHFFRLDVSEPASINTFVSWFARIFGALDILVSLFAINLLFLLILMHICLCTVFFFFFNYYFFLLYTSIRTNKFQ